MNLSPSHPQHFTYNNGEHDGEQLLRSELRARILSTLQPSHFPSLSFRGHRIYAPYFQQIETSKSTIPTPSPQPQRKHIIFQFYNQTRQIQGVHARPELLVENLKNSHHPFLNAVICHAASAQLCTPPQSFQSSPEQCANPISLSNNSYPTIDCNCSLFLLRRPLLCLVLILTRILVVAASVLVSARHLAAFPR